MLVFFILQLWLLFAMTGFVPSYPPFPLTFTFSHLFFNSHTPFSPLTFVVVCLYRCHDFVLWFVFRFCFCLFVQFLLQIPSSIFNPPPRLPRWLPVPVLLSLQFFLPILLSPFENIFIFYFACSLSQLSFNCLSLSTVLK